MTSFSSSETVALERTVSVQSKKYNIEAADIEKCQHWIQSNSFKKVCLQFPDQLLYDAKSIAEKLTSVTSASVFILADTSYGSCCVDGVAAAHVEADSLIHFGPACLSPFTGIPVLYIFERESLDIQELGKAVLTLCDDASDAYVYYDTKHHGQLKEITGVFRSRPRIRICPIAEGSATTSESTVSGRRVEVPLVDNAFGIFIGPDSMTLLNLTYRLPGLNWYIFDNGVLKNWDPKTSKMLMKQSHLVEKLKDAQVVGVLVATLSVSSYLTALNRVKCLCRKAGKKCYTFAVGRPNVAKLANFPEVDIFVLISCLENPLLLENKEYYKPIVSLMEVELALGGRKWTSTSTLDFRELLPGGSLHESNEENTDGKDEKLPDVSLVTGHLRGGIEALDESEDIGEEKSLVKRHDGTISLNRTTQLLENRSWRGLEQQIGQTPVVDVEQGRRGLPVEYHQEGLF